MKVIFAMAVLIVPTAALSAEETEIWYDASGTVVKATRLQPSVERFVPAWERREAARRRDHRGRVQRTRSGYGYPFHYYGHGYGHGYNDGCRPGYGRRRGYDGHRRGGRSWFHFNGTCPRGGWSLRVGF